jgi:hypothetical protein
LIFLATGNKHFNEESSSMKNCILIFATVVFSAALGASEKAFATYNPYALDCTYDANRDGFIHMKTGKINTDTHDFPVSLTKVSSGESFTLEFKEVLVIGKDDLAKLPPEDRKIREELLQLLGVREANVFTTTRFILFMLDGTPTMVVWKFNSDAGNLAVGIQARNSLSEPNSFVVCK